jgi:hypothetical protein
MPKTKKGSVLIYLLFIISVISYMLLDYSQNTRIRLQLSGNFFTSTQKKLDIGNLAILVSLKYLEQEMTFFNEDEENTENIKTNEIEYHNKKYLVTIVKESSLIDINNKDENVIRNAIAENLEDIIEPDVLDKITDAILDWRDSDNETRLNGAENEDYNIPYLPYNKNFESLLELKLVKGVTDSNIFFKTDGNESDYKGLFTIFTVWKKSATVFSVKENKKMNYKNILRIYVKTDKNQIYVYFTGINNNKIKIFKHYRLI